jgi:Amt family ammonium transporter
MLTSTVLVLLMTIPGLALFYGGLVRSKNMLSVLAQVFYTVCLVTVLWALYGYSLAFTGGSDFIGGFSKAFLMGVTPDSKAATFSVDANISELVYMCFQMTFAAITPGPHRRRLRRADEVRGARRSSSIALGHADLLPDRPHGLVLGRPGRRSQDAARKLAAAGGAANAAAKAEYDAVIGDAGMLFKWGALDFAGGTVVHINAGIAGLVGCLMLGKRIGYGRTCSPRTR